MHEDVICQWAIPLRKHKRKTMQHVNVSSDHELPAKISMNHTCWILSRQNRLTNPIVDCKPRKSTKEEEVAGSADQNCINIDWKLLKVEGFAVFHKDGKEVSDDDKVDEVGGHNPVWSAHERLKMIKNFMKNSQIRTLSPYL